VFIGEGDLRLIHFCAGIDVVSSVSLLKNWHNRNRRNILGRNRGGCVLFSSKCFVINRKSCEAEIAESTPCREKNKTLDKTVTNTTSQQLTTIVRKNSSSQKVVWFSGSGSGERSEILTFLLCKITIITKMTINS
jgi:hypothetical protein